MPLYDYDCASCGKFTEFRPMASFEADAPCPECGGDAPRAFAIPHFAVASTRMKAQAINEKSAHAPETTARTGRHPANCGCCKPRAKANTAPAAKGFPGTRPWMISH
ncbi:MAG: hypothetical protein B7Z80_07135 [Rhodospirillales bacterium 20-64-7]|nr:MAG: hypothetical protein B7Z80_07135 [Rhodospirillales bacterium 20-64-7]